MRWAPALAVLLASASGAAVAVGAGLTYLPAGLIVAGVEGMAAAWGVGYVWARWAERNGERRTR